MAGSTHPASLASRFWSTGDELHRQRCPGTGRPAGQGKAICAQKADEREGKGKGLPQLLSACSACCGGCRGQACTDQAAAHLLLHKDGGAGPAVEEEAKHLRNMNIFITQWAASLQQTSVEQQHGMA